MSTWALVPAAGEGRRMGTATPKQFLSLGGRPLLVWTLQRLASWRRLEGMVLVAPPGEVERTRGLVEGARIPRVLRVVAGGSERQESVRLGLDGLVEADPEDVVFVHDGVRPFPPVERFHALERACRPDGALLALPCRDTLKRGIDGMSAETLDRTGVWEAQTPQAFPVRVLREALNKAVQAGFAGTDEASLVEAIGLKPHLVQGDPRNIKVTLPEDLPLAEAFLQSQMSSALGEDALSRLRVGHGYDVHRLVATRKLVLGGVEIAHERGLLGHSDADVLAHAVADACLGAAGLGDIGRHFPDSDPAWAGASSLELLRRVALMVRAEGFRILRVDATLVAQRPKVADYVSTMEENLSAALGASSRAVTVKATTTEGLGFEGRMEGISAHAVSLLAHTS